MFLRSMVSVTFLAAVLSACGINQSNGPASLSTSASATICQDADHQFIVEFPKVAFGRMSFQLRASDMGKDSLKMVNCLLRTDAVSKFTVFRCSDRTDLVDLYTGRDGDFRSLRSVVFYPTTKATSIRCRQ